MSLNAAVRRAAITRPRRVDESVVGTQSGVAKVFTGYLPMTVATLIVVLPLLWMVLGSFKTPSEIVAQDVVWWPHHWAFDAYRQASRAINFPRLFLNTVIVTVIGATVKLVLACTSAYAFAFLRFPGRNIIFVLVLVALMVPAQVSLVPNYVLISQLGGVNSYWGIIVPGLGTAFGTFLLRQHFLSLPVDVMEAAEMDGAGHLTRLCRMVIPMSTPAIATVALVTIVDEWNNYIWPLVITSDTSRMVLPVGLTALQAVDSDAGVYPVLMAGAVFVIVPILVVFVLLQRYLVAGLTQGAVK
ncbi:carbohydrate ABC transporter permease [Cutibacterium sp. WCA-380-WT-3A]|uniref:Carbohydrate ABC transporter permease n=1 Tax=Cutibacterium porci TaxID=2605781 RepID=A0A7K0J8G6_9ACTN|nr:carbohydrate ABC transporter permease [Cutibacterium porci]MSS46254.1 carbohydrate ABC transporter permease [Cutibacterium porci]